MSDISTELSTPRTSPKKPLADDEFLTAIGSLSKTHLDFARAYSKSNDATKAYLISHPNCTSEKSAKRRGSALARLPGVVAFLARQRVRMLGVDGEKAAWEHEVRMVAFAGVNLKKVPVKEKLSALRTLAEAKGWLKQPERGAGLRATFNFRIGGAPAAPLGRSEPQTIEVDVDAHDSGGDAPAPATLAMDTDSEPVVIEIQQEPEPARRALFDTGNS